MVLDLETTGLNPRTDKIIEIGALLVEDGEILDTFSTFVSPSLFEMRFTCVSTTMLGS